MPSDVCTNGSPEFVKARFEFGSIGRFVRALLVIPYLSRGAVQKVVSIQPPVHGDFIILFSGGGDNFYPIFRSVYSRHQVWIRHMEI